MKKIIGPILFILLLFLWGSFTSPHAFSEDYGLPTTGQQGIYHPAAE